MAESPSEGRDASVEDTLAAAREQRPEGLGGDPRELAPAAQLGGRARLHARLGLELAPTRIGRFEVLDQLGEGGMGVVLAAHDADLDRKVAVKLLSERRVSPEGHARLVREARSLAKLSHPNIVHVYEVGEFEGVPYLAMELVDGVTLRGWLTGEGRGDERARPDRLAVLQMFLQVGEGLAAAHAAGVVHRDFKPENVLVGADERARVADFGLALLERTAPAEAPSSNTDGASDEDPSLTQTGALLGTPAYMAPEQWRGREVDARSDQFAFCVALYEALYGRRPFTGDSLLALREQVLDAVPVSVPAAERVPSELHAAILRGLAADPEARWPELAPLLELVREAIATVQPGIFADSPLPVIRTVAPIMLALPLIWFALELGGVVDVSARSWAWVSAAQLFIMGVTVLGLRHRLLGSMSDRRVIVMPTIFVPLLLAHRALALTTEGSIELMFAYDFLTIAAVGSAITLLMERGMWPMILLGLSLALTAALRPSWAPHLWLVFTLAAPPVVGISASRALRRRPEGLLRGASGLGWASQGRSSKKIEKD
jgi:hypothetical protein